MTSAVQTILDEALRLSPVERAEVVDGLLRSLGPKPDPAVDAAWAEEAESRIDAHASGKIPADAAENVFARIARRRA